MPLIDPDTVSCNESQFSKGADFPDTTGVYRILEVKPVTKNDELSLVMDAVDVTGKKYTHWFNIQSSNDITKRISQGELKGVWDACKLTGALELDRLQNFKGKFIEDKSSHSKGKQGDKTFVNFDQVHPASGFDGAGTPRPAPVHSADDALPGITEEPPRTYKLETPAATTPPVKNWPGAAAK